MVVSKIISEHTLEMSLFNQPVFYLEIIGSPVSVQLQAGVRIPVIVMIAFAYPLCILSYLSLQQEEYLEKEASQGSMYF